LLFRCHNTGTEESPTNFSLALPRQDRHSGAQVDLLLAKSVDQIFKILRLFIDANFDSYDAPNKLPVAIWLDEIDICCDASIHRHPAAHFRLQPCHSNSPFGNIEWLLGSFRIFLLSRLSTAYSFYTHALKGKPMPGPDTERQNFNVSPEEEAELQQLRETLGAASVKMCCFGPRG
jgi:hypothetical protein